MRETWVLNSFIVSSENLPDETQDTGGFYIDLEYGVFHNLYYSYGIINVRQSLSSHIHTFANINDEGEYDTRLGEFSSDIISLTFPNGALGDILPWLQANATKQSTGGGIGLKNLSSYNQDLSVPRKKDLDSLETKIGEKQPTITTSGILKGDGAGGVSAAVANTDYATCTNLRNGTGENSALLSPGESVASGTSSFACGALTTASGFAALAEGVQTESSGNGSHAEGYGTKANHNSQHVEGWYNIEDDSTNSALQKGNYAHIVGNGTRDSDRSNAHTLDWSGNAWFAGDVYVGSTSGTNKDAGSKKLITADEVAGAINLDSLKEVYFGAMGSLLTGDIVVHDNTLFKDLAYQLQQFLLNTTGHAFVEVPRPCLRAQLSGDNFTTVVLKYSGVGTSESNCVFNGICFDHANQIQYSVILYYNISNGSVEQVLLTEISNSALPTVTTADNGKFLRVVSGAWAAATVDNANGGAF